MTEKNNEQHDIDELFKGQFGDFEVPKLRSIEPEEEASDEIDQLFQNRLEELEQRPDEKIWTNVQKELPLHLIWKKRLNHLSRIAAILLIGLFISVLVSRESSAILSFVGSNAATTVEDTNPESSIKPADFVFDVHTDKDALDQRENSKTLFQDDSDSEVATNGMDANSTLLDPLAPLPSLPLQEVSLAGLKKGAAGAEEGTLTDSDPLRGAGTDELDQYDADIIARGNSVNPAQ